MKGQHPPAGNERAEDTQLKQGEFRFQVDSGLLFQLGEELVSKPAVALAELVKNAYDADATYVAVDLKDVASNNGTIEIIDDGTGIPFERLQDTWMRIATSDKAVHRLSDIYSRPRAGAKGIGRFAARRLANKLELVSTAWVGGPRGSQEMKEETRVVFNWDDFTPGSTVQSVPVSYEHKFVARDAPTGVMLLLSGLRDVWTEDEVRQLYNELMVLVNPTAMLPIDVGDEVGPPFDVRFECKDYPQLSGSLMDGFMGAALAVLDGEVDKDGRATYSISFRAESGHRGLHRTRQIKDKLFPRAGPAKMTVRYFQYAGKSEGFAKQGLSVRSARKLGSEHGGVRIVMDRFLVPPYGQPGDDWLGLEEARAKRLTGVPEELNDLLIEGDRPMLLTPGNNQLFGCVVLSKLTAPQYRVTANRERLVEGPNFVQLRDFVRTGIFWLTLLQAQRTYNERMQAKSKSVDTQSLIEKARETISTLPEHLTPELRGAAMQVLEEAVSTLHDERTRYTSKLQLMSVLASTGTVIFVVEHDLKQASKGIRTAFRDLKDTVASLPPTTKRKFDRHIDDLQVWIDDIGAQEDLLDQMIGEDSRKKRKHLNVRPIVDEVCGAFKGYMRTKGVVVANDVPRGLTTRPMLECELRSILLNLLTNALKALLVAEGHEIRFSASAGDTGVTVEVCDTGAGADPAKWEWYFEPFNSDSATHKELGAGTGLGLTIARDLARTYGGDIRFVQPTAPWKTCVRLELPSA